MDRNGQADEFKTEWELHPRKRKALLAKLKSPADFLIAGEALAELTATTGEDHVGTALRLIGKGGKK